MKASPIKSIMSGALACVLGLAGGWLAKPKPAEEPPSQPVASSRHTNRVRQISTRKQANLSEAEIRELGRQLDDSKDPKAAFAHGKLLAGMTLENAELIGEYLEGNEYYFRLGELQKSGILELRDTIDRHLFDQAIAGWVHSDFEGAMIWYGALPRKTGEKGQDSLKSFAKAIAGAWQALISRLLKTSHTPGWMKKFFYPATSSKSFLKNGPRL
jgi:hypothetical protein